MRWLNLLPAMAMMAASFATAEPKAEGNTNLFRLTTISLKDQFNQPHTFGFPQPGISILTVADQKGSEQIESWVRPLKARYPTGLTLEGVADVSGVPAPLRPLIRRKFCDAFPHPLMLDWSGSVVKQLKPVRSLANVLVLNTNGIVLTRFQGAAEATQLARLFALLDAQLPRVVSTNAGPKKINEPPDL